MPAIPTAIRPAIHGDAEEAAALLRRSITQLCAADHGNDPARLSHWLSNKTPEHFRGWIADPLNAIFVAICDGQIAGACGIREGEGVILNYILPDFRSMGVSSAMMDHLESTLVAKGQSAARLVSTHTARRFYERRGYLQRDLPAHSRDPFGIDMEKTL